MAICEPLRRAVESGHVEDSLLLTYDTGEMVVVYGVRVKDGRRKHGPLLIFNYCPYCGTEQTRDGLDCKWAGAAVEDASPVMRLQGWPIPAPAGYDLKDRVAPGNLYVLRWAG